MGFSYGRYQKVEELLQLQHPLSAHQEHDEILFIIIQHIYEICFKQILHKLKIMKSYYLKA